MATPIEPHRLDFPPEALPELERSHLCLVLDRVRSAFNVGALFRTADGAAARCVFLVGLTPHPPHPQLEKTALGGTSYVPWVYRESFAQARAELPSEYQLVALDNSAGAVSLWDFQWPKHTALIVGNEVEGVSQEALSQCQHKVFVPMLGYKRSLNVTTASGIAIYDYLRTFRSGQG
ncbi:MAG TPA: TrmH family RNA methyltransferase [Phycisphaerales bacterium]|nr:TrmH family RNA methyltransferase [Phycisphaerales bacterium]